MQSPTTFVLNGTNNTNFAGGFTANPPTTPDGAWSSGGGGSVSVVQEIGANSNVYVITFGGSLGQATSPLPLLTVGSTTGQASLNPPTTAYANTAALQLATNITISTEPLTLIGIGVSNGGALENAGGSNTWASPITLATNSTLGNTVTIGADTGTTLTLGATNGTAATIGDNGAGINVTKVGSGTLVESGTYSNTYGGLTTVNGGTLQLNVTGTAVPGSLVVGNGTSPAGSEVVTLEQSNQIGSGTSTVTVNSDGVFNENASVSQTLQTLTMTGSQANLAAGSSLTVSAVTMTGAQASLAAGSSLTAQTLTMTGSQVSLASGTSSLTVNTSLTGAASASGIQSQITGTGTLVLGMASPAITVNGPGPQTPAPDMTIGAVITTNPTTAGMTKLGGGTLELTNDETFTGTTTVTAGTLLADAPSGNTVGAVTLNGGTLGGTDPVGIILPASSTVGGTAAPGNSNVNPGTLTSNTGSTTETWNSATAFSVTITGTNPTFTSNELVVQGSGGLNLNNAQLTGLSVPVPIGYAPFTIIQVTGGQLTGTFQDPITGNPLTQLFLNGQNYGVTYDYTNNRVQLTRQLNTANVTLSTVPSAGVTTVDYGQDVQYLANVTPAGVGGSATAAGTANGILITTTSAAAASLTTSDVVKITGLTNQTGSLASVVNGNNFTITVESSTTFLLNGTTADTSGSATGGTWTFTVPANDTVTYTVTMPSNPSFSPITATLPVGTVFDPQDGGSATAAGTANGILITTTSAAIANANLATGDQVEITGLTDQTGSLSSIVNGTIFTITVESATTFLLNGTTADTSGSAGGGTWTFIDNNNNHYGGQTLNIGSYVVQATYNGDPGNFASSSAPNASLTVQANPTTLVTNPSNSIGITYGQSFTISATVTPQVVPVTPNAEALEGNVVFTLNGTTSRTLSIDNNGTASATFPLVGSISSVVGTGSGPLTVTTTSTLGMVNGDQVEITGVTDQTGTLSTSVNNNSFAITVTSGTTFTLSGTSGTGSASGGTWIDSSFLTVGSSNSVTATYQGDGNTPSNYTTSTTQNPIPVVVGKATPTVSITASVNEAPSTSSFYGQSVTFTATVKPPSAGISIPPNDTVTFMEGGAALSGTISSSPTDAQGDLIVSLTTSNLSAITSPHSITAVFAGDTNYNSNSATLSPSFTVNPDPTATALSTSANPILVGQTVSLLATVKDNQTGGATPSSGSVQFYNGTTLLGTSNISTTLSGNVQSAVGDGTNPIVITTATTFGMNTGDNVTISAVPGFAAANGTFTITVINATSFSLNGTGIPADAGSATGGTGTWTDTSFPSNEGVALFITNALPQGLNQALTADYVGTNTNFGSSNSSTVAENVETNSTVTVSASPPSAVAVYGQPVTLTATVAAMSPGSGAPTTGTVTFTDGSFSSGPVSYNAVAGAWVYPTAATGAQALPVARGQTITATYSGSSDGLFLGNSGTLSNYTVNPDSTSTVVLSSSNPATLGQSVTFTATVTNTSAWRYGCADRQRPVLRRRRPLRHGIVDPSDRHDQHRDQHRRHGPDHQRQPLQRLCRLYQHRRRLPEHDLAKHQSDH